MTEGRLQKNDLVIVVGAVEYDPSEDFTYDECVAPYVGMLGEVCLVADDPGLMHEVRIFGIDDVKEFWGDELQPVNER